MPSSRGYSIVEPHPSASSHGYITTGRGGAGNLTKTPSSVTRGSDATGPASRASLASLSQPRKSFTTGRGGAGNVIHPPSERAIFSFDEELERQLSQERHAAPVYHVGRGGAGNVYASRQQQQQQSERVSVFLDGSVRRKSEDGVSNRSTSSSESGADIATRGLKKGWKKITHVGNYMVG